MDEKKRAELRQAVADELVVAVLDSPGNNTSSQACVDLFTWMVANERLLLRFAFPQHVEDASIFHEKMGYFEFPSGDSVAFTGSANETLGGHHKNYESLDVYRSWVNGERDRVGAKVDQFEEAWTGKAVGLKVESPSRSVLQRIRVMAPNRVPGSGDGGGPELPGVDRSIWRHQEEAVETFLRLKNGVLEMATGTGKTRTALKILSRLTESGAIRGAVICTSGTDLLRQWTRELNRWVLDGHEFSIYQHFASSHDMGRFCSHPEGSVLVISREQLAALLQQLPPAGREPLLVVHDEVHGLGSPGCQADLGGQHRHFGYRLGLSATPEREYDVAGTAFITEEIGEVIFEFGLEDAIRRGILCEFDYVPLRYELLEEDRQRIRQVYALRAAREHQGDPMTREEFWTRLAHVYKTATQKPAVFSRYLEREPSAVKSAIVFVHTQEYGNSLLDLIHRYTPRYGTYYADDHRSRLEAFSRKDLDCLITCHRLSQGIDIRNLRRVILFSSDRARLETIQRMGRCLRTDPADPAKRATVVDFVREDEEDSPGSADRDRAEWLSEVSEVGRESD
ncbi:DEAD/DEAH box helicase family protein [Gemmatimonadota bacterium]